MKCMYVTNMYTLYEVKVTLSVPILVLQLRNVDTHMQAHTHIHMHLGKHFVMYNIFITPQSPHSPSQSIYAPSLS